MTSYLIDGVLLLALLLTSFRVGAMYRELKRLRGYQAEYVDVFGQTSRAADQIGEAVRHLGKEGRDAMERLAAMIEEGRQLAERLELAARANAEARVREMSQPEDIGTYSRKTAAGAGEGDSQRFKNEILKIASDNRRLQDRDEGAVGPASSPQTGREFRLAPSVKTLRAAGGNG